jgi:hypothetical protein
MLAAIVLVLCTITLRRAAVPSVWNVERKALRALRSALPRDIPRPLQRDGAGQRLSIAHLNLILHYFNALTV